LVLHDAVSPNRERQFGRCQHYGGNAPIRGSFIGIKGPFGPLRMGFGEGRAFPNACLPVFRSPPSRTQCCPHAETQGPHSLHAKSLALAWAARYLGSITSIADCFGGGLAGPLFFVLGPLFDHRTTSA
jgi:hypothetical protein